jgi:hypothetical protein
MTETSIRASRVVAGSESGSNCHARRGVKEGW